MKVLVLGGYGAVGVPLVEDLRERGHEVLSAGRDPTRADVAINLRDAGLDGFRRAAAGVDVVVNAAGLEDPRLVEVATATGAAFVDVTATSAYVAAVEASMPAAPVLLSVGLTPGLTTLLAAELCRGVDLPARIDIGVLLGAGDAHGAAAMAWSIGLLGGRFPDAVTGQKVRNYTRPRKFDLPVFGRRRLYRLDISDQHTLTRDLGIPVRTYFGVDSRLATAALAVLTRVPAAGRLAHWIHAPGSDRWLAFATSPDGRARWASGRNQSLATAVVASWATRIAGTIEPGVHHLHGVASLADLPGDLPVRLGALPP